MRHTRAHTRNRRAHHKAEPARLSKCPQCEAMHVRHRACLSCGTYRGREVFDALKKAKKQEKKAKQREREAS